MWKKVLNILELWEDFRESVPFEEMQIESILYVALRIKNNFRASFRAIFEPSFLNSFRSSLFTSLFNLINHEHTFSQIFIRLSYFCHISDTEIPRKCKFSWKFLKGRENKNKSVKSHVTNDIGESGTEFFDMPTILNWIRLRITLFWKRWYFVNSPCWIFNVKLKFFLQKFSKLSKNFKILSKRT